MITVFLETESVNCLHVMRMNREVLLGLILSKCCMLFDKSKTNITVFF